LASGLSAAALPASSIIKIQGKFFIVNNSTFTIRGVCYSAVRAGNSPSDYEWWSDPGVYNTDFPLISAMGANTIRTYAVSSNDTYVKAVLASAAADGLYVIMGYSIPSNQDFSNPVARAAVVSDFQAFVNKWKNYPAVLMWNFGNEVYYHTASLSGWYSLIDEAAAAAHAAEGANYHPVTTAIPDVELTYSVANDTNVPHLDIWGLNIYRGKSFGNLFTTYASTKPFFMSEWGCDVYDSRIANANEGMQSDYLKSQWLEMSAHLAGSGGSCAGGTLFEWCDEWWKGSNPPGQNLGSGGVGGVSVHDTATDWTNLAYDDPAMNEEWWGIVGISLGSNKRSERIAYQSVTTLWGGTEVTGTDTGDSGASAGIFEGVVRNFPNPFINNGTTTTRIKFLVQGNPVIKIEIFNMNGVKVRELTNISTSGEIRESFWDGRDSDMGIVPFGLYICKVQADTATAEEVQYRKIAVVK